MSCGPFLICISQVYFSSVVLKCISHLYFSSVLWWWRWWERKRLCLAAIKGQSTSLLPILSLFLLHLALIFLFLLLLYVLLLPPLHHRGPRPWVDNPPSPALRRAEGTPLLWLIHGQENQPQPHRKTMNQLLARDKKVPKKGWNYGLRGNIDKVLIMEKRLWILYGCGNPLEWTSADERGWKYVRKDPMDMFICLSLQFADSVVNRG